MIAKAARSRVLITALLLSGCAVGPNYVRPSAEAPPAYKEAAGWIVAQPDDATPKGDWWTVFNDPVLNQLEGQVEISNQNLAAAEAAYREAVATVAEDRAALFPTVSLAGSATRSKSGGGSVIVPTTGANGAPTTTTVSNGARNAFQLGATASWEPDLWGQIRREIEGAKAQAQASQADLINARLSAQSTLAVDYVGLRADDEQERLLNDTVTAYQRSLKIAQDQYNAGITAKSDLLSAQSQLASAQAQATDIQNQRAQFEHAIAMLIGKPPADLTIVPTKWTLTTPDAPLTVPSVLLQRRPDIAASERLVAAANAQIGVQEAAYFPTVSLTGQGGLQSSTLASLFSASSSFWSLGANVAETILDFGARHARVQEAKAAYDEAVAQYRQTVLAAFQEVEDDLAADRVLGQEIPYRAAASQEADQAEQIALNQYKAGTTEQPDHRRDPADHRAGRRLVDRPAGPAPAGKAPAGLIPVYRGPGASGPASAKLGRRS